jgi:hypothetical protein
MEATNTEIARCGLCTEGAVRVAIHSKRLDPENLESVLGFVLSSRVKSAGLEFMEGLCRIKTGAEMLSGVKPTEPYIDYSESQE